jgi:predicted nucleic acid-binding protein
MADPIQRRYWDSVCCLGFLKEEDDKVTACQSVISDAEAGRVEIVVSTLVLAEVLWIKGHDRVPRDSKEKIRNFFRRRYFLMVNVDLFIAEQAQDLVWDYNLRHKDAIHVASALALKCASLDTFDPGMIELDGQLSHDAPMRIGPPAGHPQHTLPGL